MKSDKDIWEESLDNKENIDVFKTLGGGKASKTISKKIFNGVQAKTIEERVKKLEEQIENLVEELKYNMQISQQLKRELLILKNKRH